MNCIETDALIIGAGPVGLFQVFELGLLEIKAHIVDSLPKIGGQCSKLYPDKPIYDIPGIPECGAQELIDRLAQQIRPFGGQFHLQQTITAFEKQADGRFHLSTNTGTNFKAKTVFIAAGVGAFQARKLKLPGFEDLEGQHVFYHIEDRKRFANRRLLICGGGDSAVDWALSLVDTAAHITLVHRRNEFRAADASVAKLRQLCGEKRIDLLIGQVNELKNSEHERQILVTEYNGNTQSLAVDDVLIFFGLSPRLGPITEWNLDLERRQICVDTEKFQTSIPGVFAVGDINTYPGKKKLILSGFHETALAAFAAAQHINPERKISLQYTTTSPKLHRVLGVTSS